MVLVQAPSGATNLSLTGFKLMANITSAASGRLVGILTKTLAINAIIQDSHIEFTLKVPLAYVNNFGALTCLQLNNYFSVINTTFVWNQPQHWLASEQSENPLTGGFCPISGGPGFSALDSHFVINVKFTNRFGSFVGKTVGSNAITIKNCDFNLSLHQTNEGGKRSVGLLVGQCETGVAKILELNISSLVYRGVFSGLAETAKVSGILFGYTTNTQVSGTVEGMSVEALTFGANPGMGYKLISGGNIANLVQVNNFCHNNGVDTNCI